MAETVEDVVPGDRIGRTSTHQSGTGTYALGSHIFASVVGRVETIVSEGGALPYLTVVNAKRAKKRKRQGQDVVIEVGNVIMGRVTRITTKQANLEILCVGETLLRQTCQGIIKKEDIRLLEVDKVEVPKCFRPGDIVRAKVVSLGDARQYYLSTAENELGVRYAKSAAAGEIMLPVSWQEMRCPATNTQEHRKVAKPS